MANSESPPLTAATLTAGLRACGVGEGQTVLVQMAMSKLGFVVGAAQAVADGLLAAVGPSGTIVVPTHSADNSEPSHWQHPPVPESWWPLIREHTPAYNPLNTPTRQMGAVAELLRRWPGALRSSHPAFSLAAIGPNAAYITAEHELGDDTGERSPLGALYRLDGHVLLIGVGHGNNSSLHLAERRAQLPPKVKLTNGSAMLVDGERRWVTYEAIDLSSDDFETVGAAFEAEHGVPIQRLGGADVRFFRQRACVDFAAAWMQVNRTSR